jgi:transcriptional regulator CtsR
MTTTHSMLFIQLGEMTRGIDGDMVCFQIKRRRSQRSANDLFDLARVKVNTRAKFGHLERLQAIPKSVTKFKYKSLIRLLKNKFKLKKKNFELMVSIILCRKLSRGRKKKNKVPALARLSNPPPAVSL